MKETGFFEESPGVKSFTRLSAAVLIGCGLVIGIVGVILGYDQTPAVAGAFVGTGALEKMVSKFAEKKNNLGKH